MRVALANRRLGAAAPHRRIEERVGTVGVDGGPCLAIGRRRVTGVQQRLVVVVMHDRRTRVETRARALDDLRDHPRHVGVRALGRRAVDCRFDDEGLHRSPLARGAA